MAEKLTSNDVIFVELDNSEVNVCIETAMRITPNIIDRDDLHSRDYLERFINVLLGEIAETMVIKWLESNNKYVRSAVDKNSTNPDLGHDLILQSTNENTNDIVDVHASIKSSLSAKKGIDYILSNFRLATKESELRDANIQVYFWLDIDGNFSIDGSRRTIPNLNNAAIIAWAASRDAGNYTNYSTEDREVYDRVLEEHRSMTSLLEFLI